MNITTTGVISHVVGKIAVHAPYLGETHGCDLYLGRSIRVTSMYCAGVSTVVGSKRRFGVILNDHSCIAHSFGVIQMNRRLSPASDRRY